MDLATKVWLANEIRIWGLAITAILGIISFVATWTHSRWQAEFAIEREEIAVIKQRESDERIATANARAAEANRKAEEEKLARIKIEERLADRSLSSSDASNLKTSIQRFQDQSYKITTFWDQREPLKFANQLHGLLSESGWSFVQHGDGGSFLLGGLSGVQVWIHPNANERVRKAAMALADALTELGYNGQLREQNVQNLVDEIISINVGTKD